MYKLIVSTEDYCKIEQAFKEYRPKIVVDALEMKDDQWLLCMHMRKKEYDDLCDDLLNLKEEKENATSPDSQSVVLYNKYGWLYDFLENAEREMSEKQKSFSKDNWVGTDTLSCNVVKKLIVKDTPFRIFIKSLAWCESQDDFFENFADLKIIIGDGENASEVLFNSHLSLDEVVDTAIVLSQIKEGTIRKDNFTYYESGFSFSVEKDYGMIDLTVELNLNYCSARSDNLDGVERLTISARLDEEEFSAFVNKFNDTCYSFADKTDIADYKEEYHGNHPRVRVVAVSYGGYNGWERLYDYVCEIPDVKEDDYVVVPVGKANKEVVAKVIEIDDGYDYNIVERYNLARLKKIIRKAEKKQTE